MFKKIILGFILIVILVFNVLRFWKLDIIPYGFHVDEVGSAVTVQCFAQSGCDAELKPWPLFGFMEYGQDKPPTYVYPGMLWAKVFGATVPSLRAYSSFVLLIGILGLFLLARVLFGFSCALIVALAATCSPWAWVVNRVALESFAAPVCMIWGLYFFWRSHRWWDWALAGFMFAAAMYAYPPARMQLPLMLGTLAIYEWRRRPLRLASVFSLIGTLIAVVLPMVPKYRDGMLARRFDIISIFNKDYLHGLGLTGSPWDIIRVFVHNFLLHLSPDFLFLTGDPSYVHSTRHLGLFSFLDILALGMGGVFLVLFFCRRAWTDNPVMTQGRFLVFLAVNFLIAIIPSALTNQELPHALRICGAWPFMMLFTGFICWSATIVFRAVWLGIALIGGLASGVLAYQYFNLYPQESKGMFDFWVKEKAEQLQTKEDWQEFLLAFHRRNYHCRYFMVHRLGMSCREANDLWWQLHDSLDKKGLF